jgi:hypothetical protein
MLILAIVGATSCAPLTEDWEGGFAADAPPLAADDRGVVLTDSSFLSAFNAFRTIFALLC